MWKIVVIFVIVQNGACAFNCTIPINGVVNVPQPLILWPNTTKFVEPQGISGIINISPGTAIEFSGAQAKCNSSGKFMIDNGSWTELMKSGNVCSSRSTGLRQSTHSVHVWPNEIILKSYPEHTVRRTRRTCYGGASILEIGFHLCERFISLMELCHDEINGSTLYVRYQLSEANIGYQRNVIRPNFVARGFFRGKNVEHLYTKNSQLETFAIILGSHTVANHLVRTTGNAYLARGHLAAKIDYIYGVQQRATFYYVNVAPQWQQINTANWRSIEDGLRKFIADRQITCDIITGTYGTMTAADINGVQRHLFLYANGNVTQIPVPMYFYKIALEKTTRLGIALITVNNPYVTVVKINASYRLCRDISSRITWLNWDRTNINKGYSYACAVSDLKQTVRELASLDVSGVLV